MTAGSVAVPTIVPLRVPQPGQHKTCIDTNTKVELKSETHSAVIYYTTNGDKPEPFQTLTPAAKNTFIYREPFRLPNGKRTIKAVAVAEDGLRESHVVTKTFDVEYVPVEPGMTNEDGLGFINDIPADLAAQKEVKKFAHKMVTGKEAWAEVQKMKSMPITGSTRHRVVPGTRNLNSRMGNTTDRSGIVDGVQSSLSGSIRRQPPDNATQAMRLQRETDFMKCVYCFAPRPSDPYARFCNECGNAVAPLPQTRITPPEAGQMGTCVHCKTLVPFNAPTCAVCEEPLAPQNQPHANIKLHPKIICVACGTGNPANLTTCVTCECKLPATGKPIFNTPRTPPQPKQEGRLMACSKCGRANTGDARFCDWCGAKPTTVTNVMVCTKCHANNHPYATFCGNCGVLIEPPQTADSRNPGICLNNEARSGGAKWMPVQLPSDGPPKFSVQTQTVGLFCPSQKSINKKLADEEDRLMMEKQARDRRPLMTSVSPGRGYWRKQIEHICAHLKAHTQNNAEFRSLIAEPRMGKIFSTAVHEDGHELSLTVSFALRGTNDPFTGEKLGYSDRDFLSSYTEGRKSNLQRFPSEDSLVNGTNTTKTKKKKKNVKTGKKLNKEEPKLNDLDRSLLKMIGKNGEGRPSEIQDLINEGADPTCVNKDGVPALHVAVRNLHVDAIPVLIQEGEDVNRKGPNKGVTALHECVDLGNEALPVIDVLLGCGANSQKKNDKGETAYDYAVKAGEHELEKKLASKIGQSALNKLLKPSRSSMIDDY